jgi:uncharacterized protein (TIGR03663 family)
MRRERVLLAVCILAVAGGAFWLRVVWLDVRPMHCDEANQAVRAGQLWETGVYHYDPYEHHGPTLYWLTLPSLWLSGAHDTAESHELAYRLVPVVFGVGVIFALVLVADGLGYPATVLAGVLTAISPAMVYYSRYYIQEMLLVLFTFATIGCLWRYTRAVAVKRGEAPFVRSTLRAVPANGARPLFWAVAAGIFVGLMHATKETWILAAAAMVAGLVLTFAWVRLRDGSLPELRPLLRPGAILAALGAACLVTVALYSSLGTNWHGPLDSVLAYTTYFRRGGEGGIHRQPWSFYLELLFAYRPARGFFWTEGFIAALALLGSMAALAGPFLSRRKKAAGSESDSAASQQAAPPADSFSKGQGSLAVFLVFYTLILTALYCAIPYKTPWCLLSFLHGMILLAGLGAWVLVRSVPTLPGKAIVVLLLGAGAAHLGWECYWLNFRLSADPRNPYVYAHTTNDTLNLASQMERLACASPEGHAMMIHVVMPDNTWPLPWYLRQFNRDRVGYWSDPAAWQKETSQLPPPSVIILTAGSQPQVDANLRAAYNRQMLFGLRPGVVASVYVRDDLWRAFTKAAAK